MLIVAPSGSTNDDTSSDTPSFSSTRSMVTGRVAPLELVVNATSCTGAIPWKNTFHFMGVNSFSSTG